MANWIRIGTAAEVPAGGCAVFDAAGNTIAVFSVEGGLYAIDNTCKHQGGPLGEGTIEGVLVSCPWHHWQYNIKTGKTKFSDEIGVRTYALEVRGEEVFVDVA